MASAKLKLDAGLFTGLMGRELLERYGGDGVAFYLYLLCAIRNSGYYIVVDGVFAQLAATDLHTDAGKLKQIFALLLRHGAFDQGLYQTLRVLTSEQIQRDYFQRTKKAGTPPCWMIACGTSRQAREIVLPETFSPRLYETVQKWIKYKNEQGKGYTETGLRALIGEIERRQLAYGDEKICELIMTCMSCNWQGIIWDKLEPKAFPGRPVTQNKSAQTAGSSIDKRELVELINQQFFAKV